MLVIIAYESNGQGGNNYSIFGIGDIHHSVGAYYEGLGGTSIAYPAETGINPKNPAMWGFTKMTRLQSGYRFNQNVINQNSFQIWQNNGKVNGIFGLFAMDTSIGLAASFGIMPYSSVNYLISNQFSVSVDDLIVNGTTTFQGLGGLNLGYIGASVKLFDMISIGFSPFAIFGKSTIVTNTIIYGSNTYQAINVRNDAFKGYGFKAGMYYYGIQNLGIGAYVEKNLNLSLRSDLTYITQLYPDTTYKQLIDTKIPTAYGFGLSYLSGKFLFGSDISFQDFSGFDYLKPSQGEFKNSSQFSIGISRLGNKGFGSDFFDKITYKVGFQYQGLYYRLNNNDINEISASVGASVPLPGSAVLDAAIILGSRGTTTNGLIQEYFGRLCVDISIGENWFKPFKR